MAQRSLHWDGASLGDADVETVVAADGIGYRLANEDYQSPLVDVAFRMLWNGDENRGVLSGWANELQVTVAVAPNQVDVDTGGAVVYGMPYENTAAVNVAVPSPTNDTRIDRIVLRRNWADQEIRITRIVGTEGGGVPAMTQSPAPSGSGVYDVPLAQASITTGGVITLTDEREYCTFGGVPGADSLDTAQLTDSTVDWADRATRTYRIFLGGGCLEPALNAGQFEYSWSNRVTFTGTANWNGASNTEGWELTGSAYEGAYCKTVFPPPNYASGDITTYVWWVANGALASTFYLRTAAHVQPGGFATATYSSVYNSLTTVANEFKKTAGITIPASLISATNNQMIQYVAYWYNSAGAEDINLLGVEFVYTGYI